ncbi:molybdopterin molybdotransferase MoeA [Streptomyces sp. 4N509B]|uniref:molybdopterin molybdotransferase MoeA n=1 Tax=Streptomyces sp. 4N509B TaxID=3457413 RepID=UPI003FD2EC2C
MTPTSGAGPGDRVDDVDDFDDALAVANSPLAAHRATAGPEDSGRGTSGRGASGRATDAEGGRVPPPPTATAPTGAVPHASVAQPPDWYAARAAAYRAARPLPVRPRPLDQSLGHTLAEPLTALTDLPAFDTSAMDGWAVAGPGPWRLAGPAQVLAGAGGAPPLTDGQAVPIATGARIPEGTTAVLRAERGTATGGAHGRLRGAQPEPGADIRPRGQECRSGTELLPAGTPVTPAVLGLAAAAGYDELPLRPRPRVDVLVLGAELLRRGLPRDGLIRDALGPLVGPWLTGLGADVLVTRRLGDDAEALFEAISTSRADVVVTTGSTAAGPVDHLRPTLRRLSATALVSGVAVRPGHPMLLARLPSGVPLVGLPGNPLAAVSGLVTLAAPLLAALAGRVAPGDGEERWAPLVAAVTGHPRDTRLVPVSCAATGSVRPLTYAGPAMLRGVASAQALAVVPPGGADAGDRVRLVDLPR